MYFNYTKYIPIVFQLQNTSYLCQGHKKENTLNVFKIHYFNYSNTDYKGCALTGKACPVLYLYIYIALLVLYPYIYIALLAVHTNQKRFQCERPREKRK